MRNEQWRLALPCAGLALALALAGCSDRNRARTNETASHETGAMGSATGTPADTSALTNPAKPAPSGGAASLSDANIAYLVDEANKADSSAGALAEKKATSADVKAFARMMMGEHHALRVESQKVLKEAKITPSAPSDDPVAPLAQQETSTLQSTAKGAAFDKAYIDQEVTVHKAVKDLLSQSESAAQNDNLKALIKKAQPVIQKHLDRAEAIQKQLSPSA